MAEEPVHVPHPQGLLPIDHAGQVLNLRVLVLSDQVAEVVASLGAKPESHAVEAPQYLRLKLPDLQDWKVRLHLYFVPVDEKLSPLPGAAQAAWKGWLPGIDGVVWSLEKGKGLAPAELSHHPWVLQAQASDAVDSPSAQVGWAPPGPQGTGKAVRALAAHLLARLRTQQQR